MEVNTACNNNDVPFKTKKKKIPFQDAHECLNQILDHLKEEAVKVSTSTPSPNREGSEEESLLINPTVHNFEFDLEHSITCLK